MHRVNAISLSPVHKTLKKSSKLYPSYNLSSLQTIQNLSFWNIFLDTIESEEIVPSFSNLSPPNPTLSFLSLPLHQEITLNKNLITQKTTSSIIKTKENAHINVTKNFNQKQKKVYSNTSSPITAIVPGHTRISSLFGWRNDPFTGKKRFHKGIDISAPKGSPIYPFRPGVVEKAGYSKSYGNYVQIKHSDGTRTLYAHNEVNLVKEGEQVDGTSPIARVGATGRATGNHLHFEILQEGKAVDPLKYTQPILYAEKNHLLETRG